MNILVYLCAFWCCVGCAKTLAQPSICQEDDQCTEGYYCERPPGFCRKCLSCEDLKRESKPLPSTCTKTIGDCGPCYPGLVNNPSGDLNAECVPASAAPPVGSTDSGPPSYLWAAIAVGAILMLLIVALVVYVLRKTDTLKILASTRASFRAPCRDDEPSPSPYPAPPPYNYLPVRPTSPPPPPHDVIQPHIHIQPPPAPSPDAQAAGLVKRQSSGRRRAAERERAGSQEARVFNYPHYVRAPDPPPSYDSTLSDEDVVVDMNQDEATMESFWTPETNAVVPANGNAVVPAAPGSAAELSTLLSEARGTTVVRPPPATPDEDNEATPNKVPCVRQDTNNNGNRRGASNGTASGGGGGGGSEGSTPLGPAPPPAPPTALTFNITVQQHNDLKLIRT